MVALISGDSRIARRVRLRVSHFHPLQLSFNISTINNNGPSRILVQRRPQWPQGHDCRGTPRLRTALVSLHLYLVAVVCQTSSTDLSSRVEKYRPIFLDDIVGNTETIERLKIIAKDGNMPHVIISGMPGIGKTTSILCLARQLLGDAYKEAVLELNASDERGIYHLIIFLY